ncbi:OLC1v1029397C1 [Oldenlandia corymbosa var. corymbosa]|uniref:OLC1v1029397C1 n=1 Tax=Oldenlandia corymbosa var. corymbosa TaxID=529605 RepID=A0AAV1CEG6_OLDCO|nr:OLC1v1029397C1 [Oldenlandia corymbosa var. corymbosa]
MPRIRKRPRVTSPVDRFDSLPELAIVDILSRLPTKDAVKTSVLSKRWKCFWTNVPTFDFELQGQEEEGNKKMAFVHFINNVFLHNVSKNLERFRLSWCPNESEVAYVNMWVRHAIIHRNVRNLYLHIRTGFVCDIPAELFTAGTLESLYLCGPFVLKVSDREVCLPKIKYMILYRVKYESSECLNKLVSGCPVLVSLTFGCCAEDNIAVFKISSLSLRNLCVLCFNCWPALQLNAPALQFLFKSTNPNNIVSLYSFGDAVKGPNDQFYISIARVVQMQHQAKFLTLKGKVADSLHFANAGLVKSARQFDRLTVLGIQLHCCKWSCLNVMLEQSTMLQVLVVSMEGECDADTHKLSWRDPSQVPKCLSSSLEKFSFKGLVGREDEVAMIRYILKHGVVLKIVDLVSRPPATSTNDLEFKFHMLRELSMFHRGSDNCELRFR